MKNQDLKTQKSIIVSLLKSSKMRSQEGLNGVKKLTEKTTIASVQMRSQEKVVTKILSPNNKELAQLRAELEKHKAIMDEGIWMRVAADNLYYVIKKYLGAKDPLHKKIKELAEIEDTNLDTLMICIRRLNSIDGNFDFRSRRKKKARAVKKVRTVRRKNAVPARKKAILLTPSYLRSVAYAQRGKRKAFRKA